MAGDEDTPDEPAREPAREPAPNLAGPGAAEPTARAATPWWDPYSDAETGVLFNKVGATDANQLRAMEYAFAGLRGEQLARTPVAGDFDLAHFQAIHKALFQDVYAWAGELRTINLAKGGSTFEKASLIRPAARLVFGTLADDAFLRGLGPEAFVEGAAWTLGGINSLHPFREGNGRTQKTFMGDLAAQAGYGFDWNAIDPFIWNAASTQIHHGDPRLMQQALGYALVDVLEMEKRRGEAPDPAAAPAVPGLGDAIGRPVGPDGVYTGPIAAVTDTAVIQFVGDDMGNATLVAHPRDALIGDRDAVDVGRDVTITRTGGIGEVAAEGRSRGRGR